MGAAAIPLAATIALAVAALPLYRIHLPARTSPPASAYAARPSAGTLGAVNSAQALRISFGRSGASLREGALRASLGLRALGFGHALQPVASVAPTVGSGRVTYLHPGVVEWYANGPRGLEQGFTLASAPRTPARGPLALAVAMAGNAHASLSASRQSVTFTRAGASLRYGDLHAADASGRPLPSWLALRRGSVLLTVDARGARYPLSIDPLVQQAPKLTDGIERTPAFFGASVALSGDGRTGLVGAPRNNGSAWVWERSGSTWQRAQLPEGPEEGEVGETGAPCVKQAGGEEGEADSGCGFGASVALSSDGNTAIVGSPREKRPCATGPACPFQGAAWVFMRTKSNTWIKEEVLLGGAKDAAGARFGRAVALSADGNTALVGAPADQNGTGAVWVFTRSGGKWSAPGTKLTASGEAGAGRFGYSIALSSDANTALIGAPGDAGYAGATWSFTRSGEGWTQGPKLEPVEELGSAHFGASVALSAGAETALVGGFRDNGNRGAVWSFARSGASWVPGQKLTGVAEKGGDWFGFSVALSGAGGFALVGGPSGAKGSNGVGTAWAFTRAGAAWAAFPQIIRPAVETPPPETPTKPRFGHSVALSGDGKIALIGGPRDEDVGGSVWPYAHEREAEGPTEKEQEEIEREEEKERAVTPEVTSVQPDQGPTGGGTSLTIRGHYLLEAAQVEFGPGSKIRVSPLTTSERSITLVTPPHLPGSVDLVVKIRGGATSATSPADAFTFITPGAQHEETPIGVAGPTKAAGGILSYGPIAGATSTCTVSLLSRTITVSSKGRTPLKLRFFGTGACRGKLTLSVKTKLGRARLKVRTIASGGFSTSAGRTSVVALALNKLGRALLRAAKGRLGASLAIVRLAPAPVQARTASVRLTLQRPHGTPAKKH